MENKDTGYLLNEHNIKLNRMYFKQFLKLHGLNVLYRSPRESSKSYNDYGELDTFYNEPILVRCIYDEHPTQTTMRKLGWNVELADSTVLIHVPYDTPNIQSGGLFIIPSGLDNAEGRVFKVLRMTNIAIYPASIACEIGPIYVNEDVPNTVHDFQQSNFNLLSEEE